MSWFEYDFLRLTPDIVLDDFDCGEVDLNDFIINEALPHQNELITVTYVYKLKTSNKVIAFFSVHNDSVKAESFDSNRKFYKFRSVFPKEKTYKSYPAVKLGRLGDDKSISGNGFGSEIINAIKFSFAHNNKTGCRLITVDAYNNPRTLNFYDKNEFEFFSDKDKTDKTRSMYFDLSRVFASKQLFTQEDENSIND